MLPSTMKIASYSGLAFLIDAFSGLFKIAWLIKRPTANKNAIRAAIVLLKYAFTHVAMH